MPEKPIQGLASGMTLLKTFVIQGPVSWVDSERAVDLPGADCRVVLFLPFHTDLWLQPISSHSSFNGRRSALRES